MLQFSTTIIVSTPTPNSNFPNPIPVRLCLALDQENCYSAIDSGTGMYWNCNFPILKCTGMYWNFKIWLYWKNEIVLESVLKCTWISSYFWVATLLNACRFSTRGERNVHSKGFSQENCSLIIHENRWSFLAIFIHLINLIKFNRFSKSNMVTGLTGLTITDVEPVDKVPRYS